MGATRQLSRGGSTALVLRRPAFRAAEAESSPVGMEDDLETSFVDHDLMVEPAEDHQLLQVGLAALGV